MHLDDAGVEFGDDAPSDEAEDLRRQVVQRVEEEDDGAVVGELAEDVVAHLDGGRGAGYDCDVWWQRV